MKCEAAAYRAAACFIIGGDLRQLLRFYRVLIIYTSLEWQGGIPIKKVLIGLCIVTCTMVSGCLNHPSVIQFTGESKNWSASYTITKLNREDHMDRFQIRYKGKDPASVGRVKYKFTGTTMSGSGEQAAHPVTLIDGAALALLLSRNINATLTKARKI